MILGEIKRYLRDGNSLRVSRSIRDTAYKVLKTREKLEEEDKEATIEKIAEAMQVQQKEVVYALDAISDPVSLFDPVYNKAGDTLMLMDQIYDEKNNDEVWTEHAALSEAMGHLGERERKILLLRYYEGKTQTEISEEVGISQAQVSRLEKHPHSAIRSHIAYDSNKFHRRKKGRRPSAKIADGRFSGFLNRLISRGGSCAGSCRTARGRCGKSGCNFRTRLPPRSAPRSDLFP